MKKHDDNPGKGDDDPGKSHETYPFPGKKPGHDGGEQGDGGDDHRGDGGAGIFQSVILAEEIEERVKERAQQDQRDIFPFDLPGYPEEEHDEEQEAGRKDQPEKDDGNGLIVIKQD